MIRFSKPTAPGLAFFLQSRGQFFSIFFLKESLKTNVSAA